MINNVVSQRHTAMMIVQSETKQLVDVPQAYLGVFRYVYGLLYFNVPVELSEDDKRC